MECRSLILDRHTLGVVARGFDRFFNQGECPEFYSDFDITRSEVFEKEDGSLIPVWFNAYDNRWEIATRSMIFAEGEHVMGGTFRYKVIAAFGCASEEDFQKKAASNFLKSVTYIFEYVSPENRIVRRYEKAEMVLLAIRCLADGSYFQRYNLEREADMMKVNGLNVRAVKQFNLGSFDEILAAIKELPALEEGYVCFDPVSGKRVKIKNPSYVAIHQIRGEGQLSMKRVYALVLENDHEEYLTYYPEDRAAFQPAIDAVKRMEYNIAATWNTVKDVEDQKGFALRVKNFSFSGVMFEARKRGESPVHVFHTMDLNKKLRLFGF